ncbi:MAG: hypothetical protein ICV63_09750 [Coleofasciculus sp. Co-bin14]|nr:hypothetical protein [Coleofasciculus sp. Co-bin14]
MIMFGRPQPEREEDWWKHQLDRFVSDNKQELAALSWGLFLERGESEDTLGIDLQPTPHFVYCPKQAIAELNRRVENNLQEILGIVDAHQPEKEVLIIGIGNDQIKLIQYEPEPAPPACFEQVAVDVDTLLNQLEQRLSEHITS